MNLLYRFNNFWNATWKSSCVSVSITFVTASFISLSHNDNLWAKGITKVTGIKVWTIGRLRNCLVAHLGQIDCDKDGVVDWCYITSRWFEISPRQICSWQPYRFPFDKPDTFVRASNAQVRYLHNLPLISPFAQLSWIVFGSICGTKWYKCSLETIPEKNKQ